jgi:hypothetical protein
MLRLTMSKPKKRTPRPKAFYQLEEVRQKIQNGKVDIRENARRCARNDFEWETQDILEALLSLKQHHFQKSDKSLLSPLITIDSYKIHHRGEDVYTHFYINYYSGKLVINSFKQDRGEL